MDSEYRNFHPNKCNVCFQQSSTKPSTSTTGAPLQPCRKCKLIKYCSKNHQLYDAPTHKPFCMAVQSILQKSGTDHVLRCAESFLGIQFKANPVDMVAFMNLVKCTSLLVSKILNRPLMHHEHMMLTFPSLCNVCMEYRPEKLFVCANCNQVAYCSKEHQESDRKKHSKWCDRLRINFFFDTDISNNSSIGAFPKFAFENEETFQNTFPKDIFELASTALEVEVKSSATEPGLELAEELHNISIAGMFSHVGTILYVMRALGMFEEVDNELRVYILGAEKDHVFFNAFTNTVLFRFLPKLRRLRLFFIGPNVDKAAESVMHFSDNRIIEIEMHRYVFHKIPEKVKLPEAHLAIAFNSGFNEFYGSKKYTWEETLRRILKKPNLAFAFTSYTLGEAMDDASIMELTEQRLPSFHNLVFMRRNIVNPFRNPVPIRNPNQADENDVLYYENGYLSICVMRQG
uniref:MYND-type domain-containing protein n=1 Tax=Anopheles epiroticus TaxID=199890 RepID=A0A182P683_9DIPT